MESELVLIPSTDTNSDSDTDNIDTSIDASGILDYPVQNDKSLWLSRYLFHHLYSIMVLFSLYNALLHLNSVFCLYNLLFPQSGLYGLHPYNLCSYNLALSVLRSFLLSFSFGTHLLCLLLKSLLPTIYVGRRIALIEPWEKDILYTNWILMLVLLS
jgi:hypothetical protein